MMFGKMIRFAGEPSKSNEGFDQQVEQAGGAILGRTDGETGSTGYHHNRHKSHF